MSDDQACQARPRAEVEREFMTRNRPRSEQEWWAIGEIERLRAEKDEAYRQRNHLVAALARLFPSGIRATNIPGWDPEWHGCVYIDLPGGQISYHYHDSQAHMFSRLPPYTKDWDGHQKEIVHSRLGAVNAEDDDPAVCRMQFPDGSVPGNAREGAEGWKKWHDKKDAALRAVIAHWDEFGPEYGFDETIHHARMGKSLSHSVICPDCRGERRGTDGALCLRCVGTAQIPRSELKEGEDAPFESVIGN